MACLYKKNKLFIENAMKTIENQISMPVLEYMNWLKNRLKSFRFSIMFESFE